MFDEWHSLTSVNQNFWLVASESYDNSLYNVLHLKCQQILKKILKIISLRHLAKIVKIQWSC